MSYNIIKKILFVLFLMLLQKGVHAQQPEEVMPITKVYHDSTWYKVQKDLWHKEILKNKKNESAWLNYFLAIRYYYRDIHLSREDNDVIFNKLFKEMEKAIPNSYVYNLSKGWHMGAWDYSGSMPYLLNAYRLNPKSPQVYKELLVRYEVFGMPEKKKEFCKKYYESNDLSPGLMNYNYNVLASLEKNAIVFTIGDNDTYPIWLLQEALGFRTDVLVLNINLCGIDDYRERKIKEAGINLSKELLDSLRIGKEVNPPRRKVMEKNIVRILAENSDRPIYIGLTAGGEDVMKAAENNLYLVGLASKYSKERIDNIALLQKNYEQNFLLDYLQLDFNVDESAGMVNWCNQNYVTPFVSLYKHYAIAGEIQKAERLKMQLEKIARKSAREKEILDLIK